MKESYVMRSYVLAVVAAVALSALFAASSAPNAATVVYCQYIGVPKGCVARAGVVLRPAPVVGVGAPRVNTPVNRGGPVNRIGRR